MPYLKIAFSYNIAFRCFFTEKYGFYFVFHTIHRTKQTVFAKIAKENNARKRVETTGAGFFLPTFDFFKAANMICMIIHKNVSCPLKIF